ncbi:hypothetical protein LOTGIDRAFT_152352 [Lottia gigantea]|uniref:Uncharacterized protein n=1 Tax=Lottia gigantea TaxID=225164 RepID=V4AMT6_LOTGI|nr:hypothetical protein LOTGIDRAFT_152352 [Lottia gigantea]ESP05494.1 hypothetical protein LOTGIDRAFT_152352 [Lottia gigantea]
MENIGVTDMATESEDTARVRTLTEKGEGVYISQRDKYCQDIEYMWTLLDTLLQETDVSPDNVHAGVKLEQQITHAHTRYQRLVDDYTSFLKSTRTQQSARDLEAGNRMCESRQKLIDLALLQLRQTTQPSTQEGANYVRDQDSIASSRSGASTTSSIARRKRAKAEAAKAALVFSQQQAEMNHQKTLIRQETIRKKAQFEVDAAEESTQLTRLDNEMTILASKKEIAMLEAEARILEEEEGQIRDFDYRPPTSRNNG